MRDHSNHLFAFWVGLLAEKVVEWFADKRRRLSRPRNLIVLFIVIAGIASAVVNAAPDSTGSSPAAATATSGYAVSPDEIVGKVSEAIGGALKTLENGPLNGMGRTISGFFLIALMVWTAVKTMAGGKGFGELIGEWVPIWVSFAFVYAFLDKSAGNAIVSTMDSIGTALGGGSMADLKSALGTVATPIFSAISEVFAMPSTAEASLMDPGSWAPALASTLVSALGKLLTGFLLVLAAVVGMGTVLMSFISLALVLALAPVMVPFVMFRPMSWVFDSWLRFLLGACMMKIVLAFLLTAVAGILVGVSQLGQQMATEMAGATNTQKLVQDFLMHATMAILALLGSLLLTQVPSIATGLLAGSAGGSGFGGMKGITQSPTGRIADRGTSNVAEAGGQAGSAAVRGGSYVGGRAAGTAVRKMEFAAGAAAGRSQGNARRQADVGDRSGNRASGYMAGHAKAVRGFVGPLGKA